MQEHTVKAFDEDITRLRGLIAEMGGLAEAAIAQSLEALAPIAWASPFAGVDGGVVVPMEARVS